MADSKEGIRQTTTVKHMLHDNGRVQVDPYEDTDIMCRNEQ